MYRQTYTHTNHSGVVVPSCADHQDDNTGRIPLLPDLVVRSPTQKQPYTIPEHDMYIVYNYQYNYTSVIISCETGQQTITGY